MSDIVAYVCCMAFLWLLSQQLLALLSQHLFRDIVGLCRDITVTFLGFSFVVALSQYFCLAFLIFCRDIVSLSYIALLVLRHSSNKFSLGSIATKMFYVATFFSVSSAVLVIECCNIYLKCRDIV